MKSPYDFYFQLMLISTNTESSNGITSNNWKTGVKVLALIVNRFQTSSVKCWTANFCIRASKDPVIIMSQLKSI